jgi:hypothetical protein
MPPQAATDRLASIEPTNEPCSGKNLNRGADQIGGGRVCAHARKEYRNEHHRECSHLHNKGEAHRNNCDNKRLLLFGASFPTDHERKERETNSQKPVGRRVHNYNLMTIRNNAIGMKMVKYYETCSTHGKIDSRINQEYPEDAFSYKADGRICGRLHFAGRRRRFLFKGSLIDQTLCGLVRVLCAAIRTFFHGPV